MKNNYDNLLITCQAVLAKWLLLLIYKTNRWDIRGSENFEIALNNKQSVIISTWHGQLLTTFMHLAKKKYYGLAGLNRDGELISRVGNQLGWKILRGSSSRGGSRIFIEIVKILRQPSTLIGITPDGPRGPEKIPKAGVIKAAQKTGAIIIPVSSISTRNWKFVNWHTFFLEKPFGKIYLKYGKPITFKIDDDFELCKSSLIKAMNNVEKENREYVKKNN